MTTSTPVLVAVAPNGARHRKSDHPAVPLSPSELAATAAACAQAGAAMIHLHVRDEDGLHTLEPAHYRPAIAAIRDAVGDEMLIQVTSEAAGVYRPADQMRLIDALAPGAVSVAIREFFVDDDALAPTAKFLCGLQDAGALLQYILYDPQDVRRYRRLLADGAIPAGGHLVLFVLGRCRREQDRAACLDDYVAQLGGAAPWMACAFGPSAFATLCEAARAGGHVRIGFENGWLMPDGGVAPDNATLVRELVGRIEREVAVAVGPRLELFLRRPAS